MGTNTIVTVEYLGQAPRMRGAALLRLRGNPRIQHHHHAAALLRVAAVVAELQADAGSNYAMGVDVGGLRISLEGGGRGPDEPQVEQMVGLLEAACHRAGMLSDAPSRKAAR